MIKNRFLKGQSRAGMRISRLSSGTLRTKLLMNAEGLDGLSKAIAHLKAGSPPLKNHVFGPMTHDESKLLHIRHADLHLSFFQERP